ncbi:MAG: PAS domain S-box protein [Promethearchaeota archaeon]|jgi:PAS domain S-box-containing protein
MNKETMGKENIRKKESDLKNLNSSEEKLEAYEDIYKNIINNLLDIVIVLDLKGNFLYVSPQIYGISGFKPEDIIGRSGFKLMHPDDIKKAADVLKEAINKKNKIYIEYRTIHKDGHYIDVSASGRIVNIEGEDRIFAIVRDISKQKRTEEKLKESEKMYKTADISQRIAYEQEIFESEKKYRQLLEDSLEGVWVINENAITTLVNPSMSRILGYEVDEMVGRSLFDFTLEEDIEATKNTLERRRKGIKEEIEKKFIRKDGKKVLTRLMASPFFNNNKKYLGSIAFVSDITERRKTENLLRESEEKYRYLFQNSPFFVGIVDLNGVLIDCNDVVNNLLSVHKKEDIIGKNFRDIFAINEKNHDVIPIFKMFFIELIQGKIPEPIEFKLNRTFGDPLWLNVRGALIKIEDKNLIQFIIQDITEKKKAEHKLIESEEKFRKIFESIPLGMHLYELTSDGKLLFIESNPASDDILKVETSQFVNKTIEEAFPPLIETDIPERYKKLAKEGGSWKWDQIDYRYDKIKGAYEVVAFQTIPGFMVTSFNDITDRLEAEHNLKESKEKYSHLFTSSPYSIIIGDMRGKIIDCNFIIDRITGYTRDDIIGKTMLDIPMFPHEYLPMVMKDFEVLLRGDIPKPSELQITKKDGSLIWVQPSASIFKLKNETYLQIIMQDIKERKESEEKLRESEEKFRTLFEIAPASIAVLDLKGDVNLYNQKFGELHGVKNPELLKGKNIRDFFIESDLPKLKEAIDLSLKGESRDTNQYTMLKEDGTEFLAEAISSGIKNESGEIIGLIGVAQDITERKNAEQKLRESEEKFRTITEQSFLAVSILQDGKFKYFNQKMTELTGYTIQDMLKWSEKDIMKIVHPDDLKLIAEGFRKNKQGDPLLNQTITIRSIKKDGEIRWLETYSKKIEYEGMPATLTAYMDVTKRKEAEEELIKLNTLKSELLRRTSHELKTPLVSIKGFSDLLLNIHREKLDDYVLATVVEIKQGCERLESLIQDILNTAELESGAVELKKREEDLSFIIKLSVRELQGITRLRNHTITLNIHDRLEAQFEQEQIHRVISSLLNNAIKYTPPSGNIEIKTEIKDNFILVSIKDSGIGITLEERDLLFTQFGKVERYGQGHDIITDGSGLGLYISKKIVELHGGEIWVESEGRNKGSTFHFTVPILTESNN